MFINQITFALLCHKLVYKWACFYILLVVKWDMILIWKNKVREGGANHTLQVRDRSFRHGWNKFFRLLVITMRDVV